MKDRIKTIRQMFGLTQADFAKRLSVDGSTVSVWERDGRVSQTKINAICKVFSINRDWLLTGNGKPTDPNDDDEMRETVDDRLRAIRKYFNLTQKEFAEELGYSEMTVVSWEKYGRIPQAKKNQICAKFGISAKWLYSGEGEMLNSEAAVHRERPRDLAIRYGCDEITAAIFERFMSLPETDKKAFSRLLVSLVSGEVRRDATEIARSEISDSISVSSSLANGGAGQYKINGTNVNC